MPDQAVSKPSPAPTDWEALLPSNWYAQWGNRLVDALLLATLLPFALPLMLLIAFGNLLVFGDLRQVFYCQPRVGWKGKEFSIIKFRTMKSTSSSAVGSWASGEDHLRVTSFGKFLRNAHLDELPQLFNIIAGDMSFIGPRPEMVAIEKWAAEEIPGFSDRLAIRPGLAGLAQITQGYTGHDVDAYAEKLEINLSYMDTMSLWLDMKIVVGTAIWMVRGKGWEWNRPKARDTKSSLVVEDANCGSEASMRASLELVPGVRPVSKSEPLAEIPEGIEPVWGSELELQFASGENFSVGERHAS